MDIKELEGLKAIQELFVSMQEAKLKENMEHEHILQHLADRDINAHIKDNKVIVHKDDVSETKKHLKKLGASHLSVTHKGSGQVAEARLTGRAALDKAAQKRGFGTKEREQELLKRQEEIKARMARLDAEEALRYGKKNEEVEKLDELSKKTLHSYVDKSVDDTGNISRKSEFSKDDEKRMLKRHSGISKAISKLTKEEVEIEEAMDVHNKRAFKSQEMKHELGHEDKPSSKMPKLIGMYFYNVPKGKEELAKVCNVKQTKSGKWALSKFDTSGMSFNNQKKEADENFGKGAYWEPKTVKEEVELDEAEMTPAQIKKREEIVKSMKKDMKGLKDRYGDRAEEVMYATATKQAMKEELEESTRTEKKAKVLSSLDRIMAAAKANTDSQKKKEIKEESDAAKVAQVTSGGNQYNVMPYHDENITPDDATTSFHPSQSDVLKQLIQHLSKQGDHSIAGEGDTNLPKGIPAPKKGEVKSFKLQSKDETQCPTNVQIRNDGTSDNPFKLSIWK